MARYIHNDGRCVCCQRTPGGQQAEAGHKVQPAAVVTNRAHNDRPWETRTHSSFLALGIVSIDTICQDGMFAVRKLDQTGTPKWTRLIRRPRKEEEQADSNADREEPFN